MSYQLVYTRSRIKRSLPHSASYNVIFNCAHAREFNGNVKQNKIAAYTRERTTSRIAISIVKTMLRRDTIMARHCYAPLYKTIHESNQNVLGHRRGEGAIAREINYRRTYRYACNAVQKRS